MYKFSKMEKPEIKFVQFKSADVITTSGGPMTSNGANTVKNYKLTSLGNFGKLQ